MVIDEHQLSHYIRCEYVGDARLIELVALSWKKYVPYRLHLSVHFPDNFYTPGLQNILYCPVAMGRVS